MSFAEPTGHEHVEAVLNYLHKTGERPVTYAGTPPPGVAQRSGQVAPTRVRIANGRQATEPARLDHQGFELRRAPTELRDFSDEAAIRQIYYQEVKQLLIEATGAVEVVVFDHTLRLATPGHGQAGVREPVQRVHNDQTFVSGPRRVRDHLPQELAEARLGRRHGIINVWRPIGAPVHNWPLALCDARTISPDDLIPSDLVYPDKVGETYAFAANAQHRWTYFPELTPEEVLLLKIYDSRADGRARLTAHTAFDDPTSAPDAPPRRSIEVRSLVFWDEPV